MNIVVPVKTALICLLGAIATAATGTAIIAGRSANAARTEAEAARRESREFASAASHAEAARQIAVALAGDERKAVLARLEKAENDATESRMETKLSREETASLRREFTGTRSVLEKRIAEANTAASVARIDFESTLAAERYRVGLDINSARARAETAEKSAAQSDRVARQQANDAAAARARAEQAERYAANTRSQVVIVRDEPQQQQYPVIVQPVCPVIVQPYQRDLSKAETLQVEGFRKIYPDARLNATTGTKGRL